VSLTFKSTQTQHPSLITINHDLSHRPQLPQTSTLITSNHDFPHHPNPRALFAADATSEHLTLASALATKEAELTVLRVEANEAQVIATILNSPEYDDDTNFRAFESIKAQTSKAHSTKTYLAELRAEALRYGLDVPPAVSVDIQEPYPTTPAQVVAQSQRMVKAWKADIKAMWTLLRAHRGDDDFDSDQEDGSFRRRAWVVEGYKKKLDGGETDERDGGATDKCHDDDFEVSEEDDGSVPRRTSAVRRDDDGDAAERREAGQGVNFSQTVRRDMGPAFAGYRRFSPADFDADDDEDDEVKMFSPRDI
jgi:hypothetical protein